MSYELPFILWDNLVEDYLIGVQFEESGYDFENLADWLDWTYWKSTSTGEQKIYIDKLAAGNLTSDTLAVLGHNLGSDSQSGGTTVSVYESNIGYTKDTLLGSKTVTTDDPFYIELTSGTDRYVTVTISPMDAVPYISVLFLGDKMEIPVGPEFSFDPDMQNIKSEKYVNYEGRVVGSAVQYSERRMSVPFKRISQTFIDSDLILFLEDHYGQMKPFFFIPDPGDVFGTDKIYYLIAPDNPEIRLPVYEDDIGFRNWTMIANGVRQSTFR